jgi:hypothetical protein
MKIGAGMTTFKTVVYGQTLITKESIETETQIPPPLPCLPAGRLYKREELPLFDKEGRGEILK